MGRFSIFDCWSVAEIPVHRGLLTIVSHAENALVKYPDGHPKYPTYGHFKILHLNSFKM